MKKRVHNKKELIAYRKALRNNLTPAEAFLWKHLKAKKLLGRRFQRQYGIKNFIVDFYCASERLIIELDGEVHKNPAAEMYDYEKTKILNQLGYSVIRFVNKMVFENLTFVLKEIEENFKH
ncbi:endonuclease domain-containing protein [Flagellimonas onchidii]|uniref:endonuclease domain-containing protein n=1 Tax=Flagellimonas onchidii TaxID=2562684 RepID=UPI0010A6A72C|nr:endonuclease domain-containing protein [Allomuricauda onchidii]